VVDTNLSYNKINPYIHLQIRYNATIRWTRSVRASVTITFKNQRVPQRFRDKGLGPGAGRLGGPLDYATFVRVFVPAGARLVKQAGWTHPWSPGQAYGKTMLSGYLIVPSGTTRTVVLTYLVPPNIFVWSRGSGYRLVVPHQPGSHPDMLQVSVAADGGQAHSWHVAAPKEDHQFFVSLRTKPIIPVPLPEQSHVIVAPGHWIEPHAFLARPTRR
jgi:hypothetical protein